MNKIIWKVLNWNFRGLNDPAKWTLIFDKIRESGCHVIFLQDAKREHVDSLSSDNSILEILTLLHLFPLLAAQEES
jgi:hypothetical protein